MDIVTTPEVRSFIEQRGGLLFVRMKRFGNLVCGMTLLQTATEPPPDALTWCKFDTEGFALFVPPHMRLPQELGLVLRGRWRPRVDALWDGCVYVA
jgi:hypothetical protein